MTIRRIHIIVASTTHEQSKIFSPDIGFSSNIPLTFFDPAIIRHLGGELAEW